MGTHPGVLHNYSKKQERAKAMKEFLEGNLELHLASDVAAPGLDIPNLTHVIHMDLPTLFVRHSGSTGQSGTVIAIVTGIEERQLQKFGRQLDLTVSQKKLFKGGIS